MRKILFSVGVFSQSDYRYKIFNDQIKKRNIEYSDRHGFEYLHINELEMFRDHYSWSRLKKAREIMNELSDGDIISNIDADMCIVDGSLPFESEKSFSYSIDTGNSHCIGSWSIKVNNWSRNLIDNLLNDEIYSDLKNDPFVKSWKEQAIYYYLCGIKKHSWECFLSMDNFGFGSEINKYTKYTIDELKENVNLLSSNWNVSLIEGNKYYICGYNNIIIRHWGGGQIWENHIFNTPISYKQ